VAANPTPVITEQATGSNSFCLAQALDAGYNYSPDSLGKIFQREDDYQRCQQLVHTKDLHCDDGIAAIPGYVKVPTRIQDGRTAAELARDEMKGGMPGVHIEPSISDKASKPVQTKRISTRIISTSAEERPAGRRSTTRRRRGVVRLPATMQAKIHALSLLKGRSERDIVLLALDEYWKRMKSR